jgi:hypothetical protein
MWLFLVAAALSCGASSEEVHVRVVDVHAVPIPGVEVRKWSGEEPREPLLGLTDQSGSLRIWIAVGMDAQGVYRQGFTPTTFARRPGEVVLITLQSGQAIRSVVPGPQPPCVTGPTRDGYRFCSDILSRLPLQF